AVGLACHVSVPTLVAVDRRLSQPATDCHNRRGDAGKQAPLCVAAGCGMSHSRDNGACSWPLSLGGSTMGGFCRALAWTIALALLLVGAGARAQPYPDRPVKIIVPIGPGGSYDLVGPPLADGVSP